jgi:serine/threonine protein kinase
MGTVWEAYDRVLERRVAAKALISEADYGTDLRVMRERMRREALALALVDHPAVVTVHDLIYDGEDPWIVMGYVDGPTLAQYISDNPELPEPEVASIGLVVLEGLLACHAKKVYHRDVKPTNIIRTPERSMRLVDFGIARIGGMRTLTPASKVLGTPEFMAPELFKNEHAGQGTDLWALGATLYYALEGRPPFGKPTLHATIGALLGDDPPALPRSRGPLAGLVLRMLRKQPSARPRAAAVLDELRKLAGNGAPPGRPVLTGGPDHPGPGTAGRNDATRRNADRRSGPLWADIPRGRPPADTSTAWMPSPPKPLTRLSGLPDDEVAKIIANSPADRAIADLLALEDEEAARIIIRCDDAVAGALLGLAAVEQPAWTRKIIEMVTVDRAGQLLDNMSAEASAAALALPPPEGGAHAVSRAKDSTVKAILAELSEARPSRAAPLVLALDDLDAGRLGQVLGSSTPAVVARVLHYVSSPARRRGLLSRLSSQFRPLVERHLKSLEDDD